MSASFGQRLRAIRQAHGLTMESIAKEFDVSKPTWSTWELGTREPKLDVISAICVRLDCTPNDLLGVAQLSSLSVIGNGNAVANGAGARAVSASSAQPGDLPQCAKCPLKKRLAKIERALGK